MIIDDFKYVNNLFEDELSKRLYEARVNWYLMGDEEYTKSILYDYYNDSEIQGLDEYSPDTKYAICGAGNFGKQSLRALRHAGYEVCGFLDNDKMKQGSSIDNVKVYSFPDFVRNYSAENVVVIIDNMRLADTFFAELFELGWEQKKIFRTKDDIVRSKFGNIYFDLPELKLSKKEIFMDAGSFNGDTTAEFMNVTNGYKKIYLLEPMIDEYKHIAKRFDAYKNIVIKQVALGANVGQEKFAKSYAGLMGSRLGDVGDCIEVVNVETIDNILGGEPITFIKFDIEGAELEALKGAVNTLKRYRPKLAISLYHKRSDLLEIPLWINKNIPGYKYYLRHYSNKLWDLVLYCV